MITALIFVLVGIVLIQWVVISSRGNRIDDLKERKDRWERACDQRWEDLRKEYDRESRILELVKKQFNHQLSYVPDKVSPGHFVFVKIKKAKAAKVRK